MGGQADRLAQKEAEGENEKQTRGVNEARRHYARLGEWSMQWNPVILVNEGRQFLSEVQGEFKKITWPSQKEAIGGTIGVVVIVIVVTTVLSVVDIVLGQLVQLIFN